MNKILNNTLWFLGGVTAVHFFFEWIFGFFGDTESAVSLDAFRFGIYAVISLAYALFRSNPRLLERDKVLNS